MPAPQPLALNTPQRFYAGGRRILAFRGLDVPADFDDHRPEDWLGSTTRLFAEDGTGLTVLADGRTLAATLETSADEWLGPMHPKAYGDDSGLLVKLLDAAERLPVHTHPDREFAKLHLDSDHGKTEAWLILEADPGAVVWLGFRDDVDPADLSPLIDRQDDQLLGRLNEIPVRRGDALLVPAGQPHAIGPGVFLVELQEPTDFSVLLEHQRFGLDPHDAFLGLSRDLALSSVTTIGLGAADLAKLRTRWDEGRTTRSAGLPDLASPYFRAEVLDGRPGEAVGDAGFSVLVVVEGQGRLRTAAGDQIPLQQGQALLTPYSSGDLFLTGDVTALRCRPGLEDSPNTQMEAGS
ncbi:MAG: class I mannose-6-phosphate isomerase [Nocardioidaceae bacterium]